MTNKQIQQQRDMEVLKFLDKFKVATTNTIAELFFPSLRMAQRRLSKLVDYGELKRHRDHFTFQYIYYNEKPKQLRHRLILTDFYREIKRLGIEIVTFENEFAFFPDLRPDGFIAFRYERKNYIAFIETELSNKLNIEKYMNFYKSEEWRKVFPTFPQIIAVTNKKTPSVKELEIVKFYEDLSNISTFVDVLNS